MDSKAYFEKVMQDFNLFREGRSLRKYCSDEGIDYNWVIKYKKEYPGKRNEEEKECRNNYIAMEADYKQQCEALLAHIARAEESYKENMDRAAKMTAKADALEQECEQKDRYIAELTAEVERIKRELGIIK